MNSYKLFLQYFEVVTGSTLALQAIKVAQLARATAGENATLYPLLSVFTIIREGWTVVYLESGTV